MKSCLIVDDSKVIRKVARHILETLEFEVEEAGDGQEALSRCEAKMPDVVLLDWNMPVMSGMEFLKLLRQRGHGDQPKVVFCTTENDMAHIRAALEAGADEYVMKPFDRETLTSSFSSSASPERPRRGAGARQIAGPLSGPAPHTPPDPADDRRQFDGRPGGPVAHGRKRSRIRDHCRRRDRRGRRSRRSASAASISSSSTSKCPARAD